MIAQVPRQNMMETMNSLIVSRLFSGFETSAPAGLVSSFSALTLFRFCKFRFYFLQKAAVSGHVLSDVTILECPFFILTTMTGGDTEADSVTIKMCRVPKALRPDQMFFRPALVFQTMLDVHVADAGLEFSVDMSTGQNRARFISDASVQDGSARWQGIMDAQLALVAAAEARDDSEAVSIVV